MSFYNDVTYICLLSGSLRNFKRKKDDLFNCSCPYCGDSQKDKHKARGYFFKQGDSMIYKCHNCGQSASTANVLKFLNPQLYQEYIFHRYKENANTPEKETNSLKENVTQTIKFKSVDLPSIKDLPDEHYAKKYILARKIPSNKLDRLFFADRWGQWVEKYIDKKYSNEPQDHRIVMPFFDEKGNLVGAQGRSLSADKRMRYLSAKATDVLHMTFGLERWNKFEKTYVVEGPIDSLFLPNALAASTSDLHSVIDRVPELNKENTIFVFDNEPHSKEIGELMRKVIDDGYKITFWPKTLKEKDVNDMVLSGLTLEKIIDIIESGTKSGLRAEIEFASWKKY